MIDFRCGWNRVEESKVVEDTITGADASVGV